MYTQNHNIFFVSIYKNKKSNIKKCCIKAKYEKTDDQLITLVKKKEYPKRISNRTIKSLENNSRFIATKDIISTPKIVINKPPIVTKPEVVTMPKTVSKLKKVTKPKKFDKPEIVNIKNDEQKNRE